MGIVDPNQLEEVLKKAGVGERTARKLRDANATPPEQTRGHGAAEERKLDLGSL